MTALTRSTLVAALVISVLGLLVLAGPSPGAANPGTFQFQEPVVGTVDFTDTCLGPGATGTIAGTGTGVGRYTENGPPTFAFHAHGTYTVDYRIDFADGRSAVGTLLAHTSTSATYGSEVTSTEATQNSATLYAADGRPLGPVTVHAIVHTAWRDLNDNHQPDPDEFTANVDDFRLSCQ
jgi:hypothetical protein